MEARGQTIMEEEIQEIMEEATKMKLLSSNYHPENLQFKKNFKSQEVFLLQAATEETTTMKYPTTTSTTTTAEVVTAVVSVQVTNWRHVLMCVPDFLPAYLEHV